MPSITMPRLSDSMVDGTIVTWLRAEGDEIAVGDEIVEIETDKAIMPYQAEHAGPLTIVARDGEVIAVGALIGHIGEVEAQAAGAPAVAPASSVAQTTVAAPAAKPAARPGTNGRVKASPVAKRLAQALGVDLATLSGSGPGGRIVKRDVEGAGVGARGPAGPPGAGVSERQTLTTTQATIARRMLEAKSAAPDFTVTMSVDMEAAVALRGELKASGAEPLPSLGDFVIRACALALREHPRINSSFAGDAIELHQQVNIGVAVAAPGSLLVPTLYEADSKSLGQIARETRALAQSARDGRLTPAEMANATFTVSNLGMYGVSHFTAVLNPPQAAILAVGAAEQQVVVREGEFVARRRMSVTLTSDHRLIYGADAAAFLASLRDVLENPLKLLI